MEFRKIKYSAMFITHNCNLRCKYCYAGEKSSRKMSIDTGKKSIDFLNENSENNCVITFLGGEPLLEFNLIKDIVDYSRSKYGKKFAFRMSTNGTIMNQEILKYFRDNEVFFVVSIDGNQAQHDSCRTFANGEGSYSRIMNNTDQILAFNPYTIAVSVINPETVPFVAEGAKSLFSKGFRYVLQTLNYTADWQKKDLNALKNQYKILIEFYYSQINRLKKIYYSPFDERIKTWAQKLYDKGELCDLANSHIAIASSGRVYPCLQFIGSDDGRFLDNVVGNVVDGFDTEKRKWFIEQNYMDIDECKGCALEGRCPTYCGCLNWSSTGKINKFPPLVCEHERMLMPLVDKLATKLWKDNNKLFERKFYDKTFPISSYIEDCLISKEGNNAKN